MVCSTTTGMIHLSFCPCLNTVMVNGTKVINATSLVIAMLKKKQWNRILFAPTGALLSPTSSFQGESIPGICHVVCISNEKE